MYRAEKVLEARNPTVAPPGRRSTRPTTGAHDRNMAAPTPADSNMEKRKRQVDKQDDGRGDNSLTTRKRQVADNNDDGHGSPERQDNGAPPKRQDEDEDEDTTPFRGRQRERPMLRAGHQSRTPSYSHNQGIFFFVSCCL
jgi:hypothetical protein